jgi:chromosomal replication initiation ATPase DnaA
MNPIYPAQAQNAFYAKKLNLVRTISAVPLNKEIAEPSLTHSSKLFAATNSYIQSCVSVLMEVPVSTIRHQKKVVAACNARMVCWYILKQRSGMSYRQIAGLYQANVSMVHRAIQLMKFYYERSIYPEYNMIIDLINTALDEKVMLNYYEKTIQQASV